MDGGSYTKKMTQYLIPTDNEFVDSIARSIAYDRLYRDSFGQLQETMGITKENKGRLEIVFDNIFNSMWAGKTIQDSNNRESYREDARAAIRAINLKFLMTTE